MWEEHRGLGRRRASWACLVALPSCTGLPCTTQLRASCLPPLPPSLPRPAALQELSNDKVAAEAELSGKLGTLRYLSGIKAREAARSAAAAAAAAAGTEAAGAAAGAEAAGAAGGATVPPAAGAAGAGGAEDPDICPVCHDDLGQELVSAGCCAASLTPCLVFIQHRPTTVPLPCPAHRRSCCPARTACAASARWHCRSACRLLRPRCGLQCSCAFPSAGAAPADPLSSLRPPVCPPPAGQPAHRLPRLPRPGACERACLH